MVNNESLPKYYRYARSIAKDLGDDLLHHVLIKIHGKEIKHLDAYIYRTMLNEFRNKSSEFNKQYKSKEPIIEYHNSGGYDVHLLNKIFLQLEMEGYSIEVNIFKDCFLNSSIRTVSEKTQVDRRTITKICKFIQNEITTRYRQLDNH